MLPIDCLHFDVRLASVQQKFTILENSPQGPLTHYLNSFKHSLIINGDDIENIKDTKVNEDFESTTKINYPLLV